MQQASEKMVKLKLRKEKTVSLKMSLTELPKVCSLQLRQKIPRAPKLFLRVLNAKALTFNWTSPSATSSFVLRVIFSSFVIKLVQRNASQPMAPPCSVAFFLCFINAKHLPWNASQSRGFRSRFAATDARWQLFHWMGHLMLLQFKIKQ